MAVSGVGRSTSIYGNRYVISGLASGMDTEGMIENIISAYKKKITTLQQKRTKTEWKQESYRSIIDKMSSFTDKYTSYRSANNLMSASFFDQAVKTVAKGKYADMVSATGKSSNDVQVNRVKQLASASTYRLSGSFLDGQTSGLTSIPSVSAGEAIDLSAEHPLSKVSGSMVLTYGGSNAETRLYIDFDEDTLFEGNAQEKAQKIADEINRQLKDQTVNIGSASYTGDELLENVVKAEVDELGNITFTDPKKNNVYISAADQNIRDNLLGGVKELSSESGSQMKFINVKGIKDDLVDNSKNLGQYLEGGSLTITLDGVQKSVKLPDQASIIENLDKSYPYYKELKEKIEKGEELNSPKSRQMRDDAFVKALQKNIDEAFGENKFKVEDAADDQAGGKGLQLKFSAEQKGSTFSVYSGKGKALGLGESKTLTSYLNTNKTLGEILGEDGFKGLEAIKKPKKDENGKEIPGQYEKDENGNPVYETDSKGNPLYAFMVNGKEVGRFSKETSLNTVMNTLNNNSDSDVKVSYSRTTNELLFSSKETGKNSKIEMTGLAEKLFGSASEPPKDKDGNELGTFEAGKDAIFSVSINGTELKDLERSSNSVDFDGLTLNLKGVFGYATKKDAEGNDELDENGKPVYDFTKPVNTEPVTFETSSDADKIVDAVKAMVEDYNAMAREIKEAYSTLPAQKSNGVYYEPLTAEEEEGQTESFIKNWNEKAKQGVLFGDNDLRSLYNRMTSAISITGENGAALRAAGITVNYSNGLSTLDFNEEKFRAALNSDPEKVRDAFTASTESGAKSNGLMQALKQPLEQYGKTSGGKGILVEKAGSPLAPSTLYTNSIQKELNNIDDQISRWEDKVNDQIDYYTNKFSKLEQLIAQMNSQSSYFSQLMGG